jgi:uncharacterized protein YndB with AHSA1/START domain
MKIITREINLPAPIGKAFDIFFSNFNDWWPAEYTWSQDKLEEIRIERKEGGMCTEIGPYGFRIDWGRVKAYIENKKIAFTWQISPKREPVPDPEKASEVIFEFSPESDKQTRLHFTHRYFERHGEEGDSYLEMMGSEYGWDYILARYRDFCSSDS